MAKYAEKNGMKFEYKLKQRADLTLKKEPELKKLEGMIDKYLGEKAGNKSKPEDWLDNNSEFLQKIRHDHLHMSSRWSDSSMTLNQKDFGFTPSIVNNKRIRSYYEG